MSNCSGLFGHMLRQLRSMLRHNRSPNKVRMDPLGSIFLWASYRRNVYLGRKKTNPLYIIWYNNWIPYDIIFSRICLWWCTRIWDLSVFVWGGVAGIVCCQSSHQIFASASADVNTVALTYLFVVGQDTESSCVTCWYIIPCGWLSGVRQWSIIGRTGWTMSSWVFPDESSGRIFSTGRTSFTWFVLKYIFVCLMWMQTAWWCRSTKESGQSVLPGFAQSVYSVQGNDHNLLLCWNVCVHPVCLILGTHTIGKGF